ncbi:uncharacterized protein METZ01_LOCUS232310, partial [marine metagenome]
KLQYLDRLEDSGERWQETLVGDVWLVADRNKKPLMYFTAERPPGRKGGYAAIGPAQSDPTPTEERN